MPKTACTWQKLLRAKPAYNRFKRMKAAWLALAEEQDWLDGEQSLAGSDDGRKAKGK
jgi:hypothetical protein